MSNESALMKKSPWISIEGVDGAGKSSHVDGIVQFLTSQGFEVVSTREPGGTPLCERLREEILNTPMSLQTEILLAFASRAEHLDKVIIPALEQGKAVVCDRFTDSTFAYQGAGSGGVVSHIEQLEQIVHPNVNPDLTLLFDLPPEESLRRLNKTGKTPDKFESKGKEYFERVRNEYLSRAQQDPTRLKVISSLPSLLEVKQSVQQALEEFMVQWQQKPKFKGF